MRISSWIVSGAAAVVLGAGSAGAADVSSNWFRSPALSPDGKTIVFTHGGDLYTAPFGGGTATPLTIHEAHETRPVWSRDGKRIAFASDRYGNFDVYIIDATGGAATRLTFHSADDLPTDFSPDGSAVVFESSRTDDVKNVQFPSGVLSELYQVAVDGGTPTMVLTTPAIRAVWDADGARMLYEDRKGYENELRKHHTSSVARDVWLYEAEGGEHTRLTTYEGEDRDPHWAGDEDSLYFLSERAGDFNVFRMPLEAGAEAEQITFFERHPVRDLSVAPTGALVFSWHGEIYARPAAGGEAKLVPIRIGAEARAGSRHAETARGGASEFAVAPSGKEVAFVARGEVFVTSTEFGTTRRITHTPEQERSVDFSPDGRKLVYAGERGGSWNIYEASLTDEDELYFFAATSIEEKPLVATMAEEFQPLYSPDGESIAYLQNRSVLRVLDVESGETRTVLPGDTFYSYNDGDHWFRWSPDSSHLAVHFYNRGRMFFTEVGIVPVDGSTSKPIDLSSSGYDDVRPRWAMDGGAILWASERYGERSHGSWGGEMDVMAVFLNGETFDEFRLTKEEHELKKELEEKRKEREEKKKKEEEEKEDGDNGDDADDADDAGDDGDEADAAEEGEQEAADGDENDGEDDAEKDDEEKPEPVKVELEGIESRIVRMTIHASDLGDFELAPDGDKLFYLARFEKGFDLWVRDFREDSTKILVKLGADEASMRMSEDGETLFLLADGSLSKVEAKGGDQKSIKFAAEIDLDTGDEREYMFDHAWRQTMQKFYRPDMHGVDWAAYRAEYEPKLAGVTNNRDFAEILSELLGELNASHTGANYRPERGEGAAQTASLGVFLENPDGRRGVRIAEIMEGGPLDKADLAIEPGMTITHIDGTPIDAQHNYHELLDRKAGKRVRLTIAPDDGESFEAVVKPVGLGQENELRYDRWVRTRRELVEELSGGRLGYVHVRGMNDASFRDVYSEVLGRHFDKEAIVVDTRFNGGGWLHDDLATFLTGKKYVDLYPRNDESDGSGYLGDTARRWTKPSVVVMSESNYSDAHFFPWTYSELEIGPTVGMPVPGTATAVWWERLHTGDVIFGIPQVGTKGADGTYLENAQLEPTYEVRLDPESAAAGKDTQIEKAVEVLLEQLGRKE
jgi:Tol biopolymer transport system component/C-terminal processing protease CtpA/Prc